MSRWATLFPRLRRSILRNEIVDGVDWVDGVDKSAAAATPMNKALRTNTRSFHMPVKPGMSQDDEF